MAGVLMDYEYPVPVIPYHGEEGTPFAGLRIDVRQIQTGAEYMALLQARFWTDIHRVMAPYVVAWNYKGPVEVREEIPAIVVDGAEIAPARTVLFTRTERLPAPAEYGPDIFNSVPVPVKNWIRDQLIASMTYRDDDPGKGRAPSAPMPDGAPNETADSGTAKPRRSRSSSSKRSPAT